MAQTMRSKTRERVEQLHATMKTRLSELVTSDDWIEALAVAAKFHRYSFSNTQLIWSQAMDRGFEPSHVAGYRRWQELGRQVRKGEHGIMVLAPMIRKDKETDERYVTGFKTVFVFDISQTDGEPLPEMPMPEILDDVYGEPDPALICQLIGNYGYTISFEDNWDWGDARGMTNHTARHVTIDNRQPAAQRFKTTAHELAHVMMHGAQSPLSRDMKEVEAESVAFIVCAALQLDSTEYSLPYVGHWSKGDLDLVSKTAERVTKCAHRILEELDDEGRSLHDRM